MDTLGVMLKKLQHLPTYKNIWKNSRCHNYSIQEVTLKITSSKFSQKKMKYKNPKQSYY